MVLGKENPVSMVHLSYIFVQVSSSLALSQLIMHHMITLILSSAFTLPHPQSILRILNNQQYHLKCKYL